jgi:cytochrome c peroxidase
MKLKFRNLPLLFAIAGMLFASSCVDDDPIDPITQPPCDTCDQDYVPTYYTLKLPPFFSILPAPKIPKDNPLTVEGIELGKKLFYEKKLSINSTISCSSCHNPDFAFNDIGVAFSLGAIGQQGIINAMPLFNLIYADSYNWNGNAESLEEQIFGPVKHPLEMMESWPNVATKLQSDAAYVNLFKRAFPKEAIDSNTTVKAIAQFLRTLISGNSPADNEFGSQLGYPVNGRVLTVEEKRGFQVFSDQEGGDCEHCHGNQYNPMWTEYTFRNNGLDATPDSGRAAVTKLATDVGKFKVPSLRNLIYTSPYMHDGRFNTLEEVVDFYDQDVEPNSPNISPDMFHRTGANGHIINLSPQNKRDLVAFLKALSDPSFVTNPDYRP